METDRQETTALQSTESGATGPVCVHRQLAALRLSALLPGQREVESQALDFTYKAGLGVREGDVKKHVRACRVQWPVTVRYDSLRYLGALLKMRQH
ncbi:hypothetical protein NHX12_006913 [Muraenolepis orangiensis]|uniref:Uncharacterized protein n=1 Tax=Muraenolepis orangiensis TaxID=630683 RepID=A0A9Q0DQB9_9TELE|nr:hypothetical protein NHX12_006913 [Muraenolepis orangiensis]